MKNETAPAAPQRLKIDWADKLRHLLQTVAFCLAIATIQYAFLPERPYEVPLVYSLAIGSLTWACIDFGRHLFASSNETGWPTGLAAVGLPACGMVLGYLGGTALADGWLGFSSWSASGLGQLRVSIAITLLAGLVGTFYFYSQGRSARLQAQVSAVRAQASEAQLKLLEAQLEPHMLFNTLANLRALIGIDPAAAQQMLDRLNAYLRATLDASRATQHPLWAEFARLADYLELMAIRMGPRLQVSLDLPDALRDVPVPPLLLQPLVENAIQHGLEPRVQGGQLRVRAWAQAGQLQLEVADTGVGYEPTQVRPDRFGLSQVRDRVATAYGGAGQVHWQSAPGAGTQVRLSLPMTFEVAGVAAAAGAEVRQ